MRCLFWFKWWPLRAVSTPLTEQHNYPCSFCTSHHPLAHWGPHEHCVIGHHKQYMRMGPEEMVGHTNWASLLCSCTYITHKHKLKIQSLRISRQWQQSVKSSTAPPEHRALATAQVTGPWSWPWASREKTLWCVVSWLQAGRGSTAGLSHMFGMGQVRRTAANCAWT